MDSVGEGEGGKIWENGIDFSLFFKNYKKKTKNTEHYLQ